MSAPARPPALAGECMVATSQPTATAAGLRMLRDGGNAADAALAAAAVLCVTEPMSTGPGGDLFALVWRDGRPEGLDAAGPAPRGAPRGAAPDELGPRSVNVPGAVAGWAALAERHGRLGLDACLQDAIGLARDGFVVAARCAAQWAASTVVPDTFAPVPATGARVSLPELSATLSSIARDGPPAFYAGPVAEAICEATWLEAEDLAAMRARWVEPLRAGYLGHEIIEMPPPTQGVAALEALALLERTGGTLADRVTCCRLALEDALREVRDDADVAHLLAPAAIERRLGDAVATPAEPGGGTVYLCAVDGDGMAVSLVQSLFYGFGSGVVAPGTGVALHNRAACFAVAGAVEPGRRPYHTIIPGLIARDGADVSHLLADEHIRARWAGIPGPVAEPAGGTVCVCVVDQDGMAVSLLQSLYESFGSGVVAGETGIVLHNRAAGFAVQGEVIGGVRPYHTLIPGMLTRDGELVGPFGLMGGFIQAQSHTQFLCELMRGRDGPGDPQAALDQGRFRIDGRTLSLEPPLWDRAGELADLGFDIHRAVERAPFGGGQAIIVRDGTLFGGSDARKDGCALGF